MLRRSTSFDTRPMPMKTAMNSPKIGRRREPEILDDLDVLPGRELADQVRRAHHAGSRTAPGCTAPCRGPIRETR